ncbi:MAG: choice-of-anchor I family protein [Chloroflexota bacterium]|nr:choice-of-anchor I family protein [Chloroflexota bacterium]
MRLRVLFLLIGLLALALPVSAQSDELTITPVGTYATGAFDEGASEIVAYHAGTQTLFVVNGMDDAIDLIDISVPATPTLKAQASVGEFEFNPNSVAIYGDIVAVAANADETDGAGAVLFFDAQGAYLNMVEVGVLPDMAIFTPDGTKVLTANEGEPSDDYTVDPEGSVSIIDISGGVENATVTNVTFGDVEVPEGVRVYGPGSSAAQDFEPEYIAISADGATAYVVLQENNAIVTIDIASATITAITALGVKDFSVEGNGIDASGDDGAINITTYPVFGMYLPDSIVAFEANGETYLITANEGDSRDYDGYSEEADLGELTLDATAFPTAAELQLEENAGGLEVTTTWGDTDADGDYDALYAFGSRSFSIWNTSIEQVYDSGDQLEQITAATYPDDFNSTHDENGSFENRSDNAGPEPEGLALAVINDQIYAFVGLERIGGVVVFNISDPMAPVFVTYVNNRDFSGDAAAGTAGDLGVEGLIVIAAEDSPTGAALLVTANEVSGTTTIFEIGMN